MTVMTRRPRRKPDCDHTVGLLQRTYIENYACDLLQASKLAEEQKDGMWKHNDFTEFCYCPFCGSRLKDIE